jgi:exonuclease SbcC
LLNLRNFMSYTDVHEPLSFDGIHVAVLTGDNGHGKSALLDAITWSLWGRARGRSVDDLIHTGASDMEVEFEFELDSQQYRVIRKRQRRGKYGTSDLQFAVLSPDGYKPLTERSVAETERLIQRTLRMSYETFTNSSFIQQGRADTFTTNSPAERKRILAEILELGYYDELEARAKEQFKLREAQLADERRLSQDWEAEIARRPEYQADLDRLRADLATLDERLQALDERVRLGRERMAQLETLAEQLQHLRERIQRLTAERTRIASSLEERRSLREQARGVLARAESVERSAAELDRVRRDVEAANLKQQEFLPLERAREKALRILAAEQARLEGEVAQRERRLAEVRQAAQSLSALESEARRMQRELAVLARVQTEHDNLQKEIAGRREQAAEKRTVNAHLKQQMLELRQRIEEVETASTCPTCRRTMDAAHKQRLTDEYRTQGIALRDQFRAHEAHTRELESGIARDERKLAELAESLLVREDLQRRAARVENDLAHAVEAQQQSGVLQQELSVRQALLTEQRFAPEARQQCASLAERIAALGYDEAGHAALRRRVAELSGVDQERQLLEHARLAAQHLDEQIQELEASLERLESECAAEEQRMRSLEAHTRALPEELERLKALEAQHAECRAARDQARDQCLYAQSKLDNCAFLERKQRESLARQDALRREQGAFGDLAYAFGRRGVQAMIIETAIPEIEAEANRILSRMTAGRMHVKFETQRDVRSGSGVIETLDLKISDEWGTRSYEMFSGGEGFRVNFAIRIALSRLLAQRAGTRLQTLVVDEGFGSQDQDGRDRIVEAIQAIESEFEKILIITHLEDLRERFPVRIEVSKTPRGSTYRLR